MITIEQYLTWLRDTPHMTGGTMGELWAKAGITDYLHNADLRKTAADVIDKVTRLQAANPNYKPAWAGKIVESTPVTTIGGKPAEEPVVTPSAPVIPPVAPVTPGSTSLDCGTAGGSQAKRDTTGMSGGGNTINCVNYTYTLVGEKVSGFEWNLYAQMDNYANDVPGKRAEHVAFYSKANKFGTATNWAACLEVHDTNGVGACVGAEVDIWTKGHDNGARIGLDVMVAGGNDVADKPADVGATAALRCSTPTTNPLAYWNFGVLLRGIANAGVQITSRLAGAVRGIELLGKYAVGLDLSQAKCDTAIRLSAGQKIAFEGTDQITLSYEGGRIRFMLGATPVLEVDAGTGDLYKRGVKVL